MATLANLTVGLTARTAAFQRHMKRASGVVDTFAGRMQRVHRLFQRIGFTRVAAGIGRIGRAFMQWGVGLGTLLTGGGLILFFKRSIDLIDTLAKTADKLGLTTEQLAGLRHAAELTGVDVRKFDMGLQRMVRRLAEASAGTGEAKDILKALGLDAKALVMAGPYQAFLQVADAVARLENQADKVRVAFKLFDSEGVALVNTLNAGRPAIEAATREAQALGLAVSRFDARKVELAKDALARMRSALRGLGQALAIQVAPLVIHIADWITEATKRTRSYLITSLDALEVLAKGLRRIIGLWQEKQYWILKTTLAFGALMEFSQGWLIPTEIWNKWKRREAELLTDLGDLEYELQRGGDNITRFFDTLRNAINAAALREPLRPALETLGLPELEAQLKAEQEQARALETLKNRAEAVFQETRTPLERFWARFDDLGMLLGKQLITWDTYARAVERAKEQLLGTAQATQNIVGTPALEFGTAPAFTAERVHRMGLRQDSVPGDIRATLQEMRRLVEINREQLAVTRELNAPIALEVIG